MTYRGIIFDLDGTLLDTLQDIADSVNEALKHLGFPVHETEDYRCMIGEGREVLAVRALPEQQRGAATVARLLEQINQEYWQRWANNTVPYQGIPELLDSLTGRNIKMAVLSNKAQEFTEMMVSVKLPHWHFEAVAGSLPSVAKKPDPTPALEIAGGLGIPPEEFLFLGDSDIDMQTAIGAGMYPVGAVWGFRSAEELLATGAKALIGHPGELLPLL